MSEDEKKEKVDASLESGGEAHEGEDEKKGGLNAKKIIMFVVLPLLLLGGGGAGAYLTGMLDGVLGIEKPAEGEHGEEGGHGEEAAEGDHGAAPAGGDHGAAAEGGHGEGGGVGGMFLEIPPQIVNLNGDDEDVPRVLRLRVQLQLKKAADKAAIEAVMPRVVDKFQIYLRELRVQDLHGSMGPRRLTAELLNRVNMAAAPVEVDAVLIQEMLIQ